MSGTLGFGYKRSLRRGLSIASESGHFYIRPTVTTWFRAIYHFLIGAS